MDTRFGLLKSSFPRQHRSSKDVLKTFLRLKKVSGRPLEIAYCLGSLRLLYESIIYTYIFINCTHLLIITLKNIIRAFYYNSFLIYPVCIFMVTGYVRTSIAAFPGIGCVQQRKQLCNYCKTS